MLKHALVTIVSMSVAASSLAQTGDLKLEGWSPKTSVEMRHFDRGTTGYFVYGVNAGDVAKFSPTAKYFFVISDHGDLDCDCFHRDLEVFSAADVKLAIARGGGTKPRPVASLSRSNHGNWPAIDQAAWQDDDNIIFEGSDGRALPSLMRFNVATHREEVLSLPKTGGGIYSAVGKKVAFTFYEKRGLMKPDFPYPAAFVEKKDMLGSITGVGGEANYAYGLGVYDGATTTRLLDYRPGRFAGPWMSPDGNYALIVAPTAADARWKNYHSNTDQWGQGKLEFVHSQFQLVNLSTGKIERPIDAPTGLSTDQGYVHPISISPHLLMNGKWSSDSKKVILLNTALPLVGARDAAGQSYIVEYDVDRHSITIVSPRVSGPRGEELVVVDAEFSSDGNGLRLTQVAAKAQPSTPEALPRFITYQKRGGQWAPTRSEIKFPQKAAASPPGFSVEVRQDLNTPPTLIARMGEKEIRLSEPDPAIENVRVLPTTIVKWKDRGGKPATGGLILPAEPAQKPYPLVIQAYAFDPKTFMPDGTAYTAYAAQALAASGFAVLMMNIPITDTEFDPTLPQLAYKDAGQAMVERVDAAVAELSAQGLVDASRVGLVGFSAGGHMTHFTITHPGTTVLKAAVAADGYTHGYWEYLIHHLGLNSQGAAGPYGAEFWDDKQGWLKSAAWFNADKVRTPTLFTMGNKNNLLIFAEVFASMSSNHRPMDFILFPEGEHQLQTPSERIASMQATVDWMNFWINDIKPADATTFERWSQIRDEWAAQQKWEVSGHSSTSQFPREMILSSTSK